MPDNLKLLPEQASINLELHSRPRYNAEASPHHIRKEAKRLIGRNLKYFGYDVINHCLHCTFSLSSLVGLGFGLGLSISNFMQKP